MLLRLALFLAAASAFGATMPRDDGYRGIWYYNQPTHDTYVYKYSGGFATYPQQQSPVAVYAPQVRKTFFVTAEPSPASEDCCKWCLTTTIAREWCRGLSSS